MATSSTSATSSVSSSSYLGKYTGVTSDTIEELLQGDYNRETVIKNKITTLQNETQAWTDISTRLGNLTEKLEALEKADTYGTKTNTSTDSDAATIKGTSDAIEGSYDLVINKLATSTRIMGNTVTTSSGSKLSSTADDLGYSGTLTLTNTSSGLNGATQSTLTATINVSGTDSLKDIADAINNAKDTTSGSAKSLGIKATIVDNRLVLTSSESGAHVLGISSTNDLQGHLGLAASGSTSTASRSSSVSSDGKIETTDYTYTTYGASTTIGSAAEFTLDGLAMLRDSNSSSDIVDGATIDFKQADSTKTVTLTMTNDTSVTQKALQDFVDQYNSVMSLISDDLDVGDPSSSNNTTGDLTGDVSLITLQGKLQSMVLGGSSVNGVSASTIGLSVNEEGTLSLDTDKFAKAMAENPDSVKDFFFVNTSSKYATTKTGTGYAADFTSLIDTYTKTSSSSTGKGLIQTIKESNDNMIDLYNDQIDDLEELISNERTRYTAQFSALDSAISEMQTQLAYITSSLSSSSSNDN